MGKSTILFKGKKNNNQPTYHQTRKIIYFSTHFKHKVGDRRPTFEPSLHHCPPHRTARLVQTTGQRPVSALWPVHPTINQSANTISGNVRVGCELTGFRVAGQVAGAGGVAGGRRRGLGGGAPTQLYTRSYTVLCAHFSKLRLTN